MLVDLGRNDIGRISEYGSVEVTQFMAIEKYSHVMHIVSNVRGKLTKACPLSMLSFLFPRRDSQRRSENSGDGNNCGTRTE